jgi:class 3 adenylate cyclase
VLEELCSDVLAVADHLGLERFHLQAMDLATPIALAVAAEHPERVQRVVVWNASARGADLTPPEFKALLSLGPEHWQFVSEAIQARLLQWTNREIGASGAERLRAASDMDTLKRLVDAVETWDLLTVSSSVTAPVLLVHQRDGPVANAPRELLGLLADARLVFVDSAAPTREELRPVSKFLAEGVPVRWQVTADARRGATTTLFRTILFTDVVASTPMLTELKDAKMREVMRDHDDVLAAAVVGHGGRVIKTMGDAFMAEFSVPSAAVEAAIEAQRNICARFEGADVPVRLRIGINAGEPIDEDGDLHGISVVIAKRLESAADASGILISDVVKQAVAGKEFEFEDRGLLALKGLDEPVRAWAVRWS